MAFMQEAGVPMAVSLGMFSLTHSAAMALFLGESSTGPKGYGIRACGTAGYCCAGLLLWLAVPLRNSLLWGSVFYSAVGVSVLVLGPNTRLQPVRVSLRAAKGTAHEWELLCVLLLTGALARIANDWSLNPYLTDLTSDLMRRGWSDAVPRGVLENAGTGLQMLYLPFEIALLAALGRWAGAPFPLGLLAWSGPVLWTVITGCLWMSATTGWWAPALAGVLMISANAACATSGTIWLVQRNPGARTSLAAFVLVVQSTGSLLGSLVTARILEMCGSGAVANWELRWLAVFLLSLAAVAVSVLLVLLRWTRRGVVEDGRQAG
jgi:hypothetical protein